MGTSYPLGRNNNVTWMLITKHEFRCRDGASIVDLWLWDSGKGGDSKKCVPKAAASQVWSGKDCVFIFSSAKTICIQTLPRARLCLRQWTLISNNALAKLAHVLAFKVLATTKIKGKELWKSPTVNFLGYRFSDICSSLCIWSDWSWADLVRFILPMNLEGMWPDNSTSETDCLDLPNKWVFLEGCGVWWKWPRT